MPKQIFWGLLIIVAIFAFMFFWILINRQKKKYPTDVENVSIRGVFKSAFFSIPHLAVYPILVIFLLILNSGKWESYKYRGKDNSVSLAQKSPDHSILKNVLISLDFHCKMYGEMPHNTRFDDFHGYLWDSITNLKEILVKETFTSNETSYEANYIIKSLESKRYIDGNKIFSETTMVIKNEGEGVPRFKYWQGSGIMEEIPESGNPIRFYVGNPLEKDDWKEIEYDILNIFDASGGGKRMTENEIRLRLKKSDFNKENCARIKIEINNQQDIPFSLFYFPAFRYKRGIERFSMVSYFKEELEEYEIGWYNDNKRIVEWSPECPKLGKLKVDEVKGLDWKLKKETIDAFWAYEIEYEENLPSSLLFKYRQAWASWSQGDKTLTK